MKLGYSLQSVVSKNKPATTAAEKTLDRVQTAAKSGFDYVQAGDHHVMQHAHYFQNVPTTARITAEINWVGALFLLPLYNPLLIAEQAGTIASFSKKFDFWCALGYTPEEFAAFDVPLNERVGRFEESLNLIRSLWTEDAVSFTGEYFECDDVGINPKADVNRVVIGGSAKPAIQRAARLGDAWVAAPSETRDELAQKIDWYLDACDDDGTVMVRRDALGLPDDETAKNKATSILQDGYRNWDPEESWVMAGDAGSIEIEFDRLAELGVDEVVIRPMDDAYSHETLETIARARKKYLS